LRLLMVTVSLLLCLKESRDYWLYYQPFFVKRSKNSQYAKNLCIYNLVLFLNIYTK
jgi:hypothetical protein